MKKHLITIKNGQRVYTFLVPGRTGADGKTRFSQAAITEAIRRADGHRGNCIKIG